MLERSELRERDLPCPTNGHVSVLMLLERSRVGVTSTEGPAQHNKLTNIFPDPSPPSQPRCPLFELGMMDENIRAFWGMGQTVEGRGGGPKHF